MTPQLYLELGWTGAVSAAGATGGIGPSLLKIYLHPRVTRDDEPVALAVPAYSAPNVGPLLEMFVRSMVAWLPMVQSADADASPVPDVLAPNVTPSLMMTPRSIVLLDPAMSCDIVPELCSTFNIEISG